MHTPETTTLLPGTLERAHAALARVCGRAGVAPPPLRVEQDGSACVVRVDGTAHVVLGPDEADLPVEHLEAVLAHELGHITGNHHRAWMWMAAAQVVGSLAGIGAISAGMKVGAAAVVLAGVVLVGAALSPFLPAWISRRVETAADDYAAHLGYAQASITEIDSWAATAMEPTGRLARLLASHPPAAERITRFERQL